MLDEMCWFGSFVSALLLMFLSFLLQCNLVHAIDVCGVILGESDQIPTLDTLCFVTNTLWLFTVHFVWLTAPYTAEEHNH